MVWRSPTYTDSPDSEAGLTENEGTHESGEMGRGQGKSWEVLDER